MGGARSGQAEVIGGSHEAFSKMSLPDPIHQHSSGERIFGGDEPVGQCEAAAARFRIGRLQERRGIGIEGRNKTGLYRFAFLFVVALGQHASDGNLFVAVRHQ